jgi:lipopolysaccharide export system permease protein
MSIIDRYLLRQFLQTFVICFLSLTGLYIVFDLFTNMEEFIRCGRKAGAVVPFIVHYYTYQSILFFDRTSGLLALISAMFTVAWIQRHNEMTALMAAGISRVRVVTPIVVTVAVLSLLSAANREIVIPRYRNELSRRPQDLLGDHPQSLTPRSDCKTNVLLTGKNTFADQKRITEPNFNLQAAPVSLHRYGMQLTAENAYYKPAQNRRPSGYLLDGVREPKHLDSRPSLCLGTERILITPHDEPGWLRPNQCFLVSNVDFNQLTSSSNVTQLSSVTQLIRGLRNPSIEYGADVRVAIHARIVQPLLDLTLLFLGLPLVVTRESRNVFAAMGMCMAVTTAFSLVVVGAQHLGEISAFLSPAMAAWVPLMIFVPVAVAMAESLRK